MSYDIVMFRVDRANSTVDPPEAECTVLSSTDGDMVGQSIIVKDTAGLFWNSMPEIYLAGGKGAAFIVDGTFGEQDAECFMFSAPPIVYQ